MFLQPLLTSIKNKRLAGSQQENYIEKINNITCTEAEFITRREWGAREPKSRELLKTPVGLVVLKYGTNTDECHTQEECVKTVQKIQKRHMDHKGWPDIGYNFLIGGDGNIYEGRGWNAKTEPYPVKDERYRDLNSRSIDLVFIGRWLDKPPAMGMPSAAADLLMSGLKKGVLDPEWEVFEPSQMRKPVVKKTRKIIPAEGRENLPQIL